MKKKWVVALSFLALVGVAGFFAWKSYLNPRSQTYGTIQKGEDIEVTPKGVFAGVTDEKTYQVIEVNTDNRITKEDLVAAYQPRKQSLGGYEQRNIGHLGLSALIPDGFEEMRLKGNSGVYYVNKDKSMVLSFFARPSAQKDPLHIQGALSQDLEQAAINLKGEWYLPTSVEEKPFIRSEYRPGAAVYVDRGEGKEDYQELLKEADGRFMADKFKRHVSQPVLTWGQKEAGLEFEETPFFQSSYAIVGGQAVLYNVFSLKSHQDQAARIADKVADSLAVSHKDFSRVNLYSDAFLRSGSLQIPLPDQMRKIGKVYETPDGHSRLATTSYQKAEGNIDLRAYTRERELLGSLLAVDGMALADLNNGLSLTLEKQVDQSDWLVSVYRYDYVELNSKKPTSLNPHGLTGYVTTFYHAKKKEFVVVASLSDTTETARAINEFVLGYARK